MPLYEYKCQACGTVFETLQKFSDPPLELHENCGGRLERLVSPPAFHFKGSGWYITDYARGNGGNGKHERLNTDTTPAKSESKPAAESPKPAESPKKA